MRYRMMPLLAALALAGPSAASATLRVVATTPEYGALASAIGGVHVTVLNLAKPTEDPHFVDARPSHIVTLNRADILIEGGADLEVGWLPTLVSGARNAKILAGAPGHIRASEGIGLLDVPVALDRSQGDLHAAGNPHFMMDPVNARTVAGHIATAFCALDAAACPDYRAALVAFELALDGRIRAWTTTLAPFKGTPIVTYHPTWKYFARRFGLVSDTYLEPKPGIPPSPPHLAEVMRKMQDSRIPLVLLEPYQSRKTAEAVAERTKAKVVEVCQFPGGLPGTEGDYLALMDANVNAVAAALGGR